MWRTSANQSYTTIAGLYTIEGSSVGGSLCLRRRLHGEGRSGGSLGDGLLRRAILGKRRGALARLGLLGASALVAEIGAHKVVPPAEAGRVAPQEGHVVVVMVVSTSPERHPVVQADREVVARVGIDRLEETQDDPDVHRDNVQVLREGTQHERTTDRTHTQDQNLERVRILRSKTERRAELVVHLVDVLVQRTPVERAVRPVVEGVLKHKEQADLPRHLEPRGERNIVGRQAKVLADGVEAPDLRKFHREVTQKHELRAAPLLRNRGDLALRLAHQRTGWSLYLRMEGIISMMIHGIERPK